MEPSLSPHLPGLCPWQPFSPPPRSRGALPSQSQRAARPSASVTTTPPFLTDPPPLWDRTGGSLLAKSWGLTIWICIRGNPCRGPECEWHFPSNMVRPCDKPSYPSRAPRVCLSHVSRDADIYQGPRVSLHMKLGPDVNRYPRLVSIDEPHHSHYFIKGLENGFSMLSQSSSSRESLGMRGNTGEHRDTGCPTGG